MTAGMQVFDGSGNVFWDTSMFTARNLGSIVLPASGGSGYVTDAGFTTGTPWCFALLESSQPLDTSGTGAIPWSGLWLSAPTVNISGSTLVWSRDSSKMSPTATWPTCTLFYGVR